VQAISEAARISQQRVNEIQAAHAADRVQLKELRELRERWRLSQGKRGTLTGTKKSIFYVLKYLYSASRKVVDENQVALELRTEDKMHLLQQHCSKVEENLCKSQAEVRI
jgi:hypothetical protein